MTKPTGRWSFGRKGGFCYDVELEALLTLREADRACWEALGPAVKVKLAFYEGTRQVYEDSLQELEHLPAGVEGVRESAIGREQAVLQPVAHDVPRTAVERDDRTDPYEQFGDRDVSHIEGRSYDYHP